MQMMVAKFEDQANLQVLPLCIFLTEHNSTNKSVVSGVTMQLG